MASALRRLEAGEESVWVTFRGENLRLGWVGDQMDGYPSTPDVIISNRGRYERKRWVGRRKGTGPLRDGIYIREDAVKAVVLESHPRINAESLHMTCALDRLAGGASEVEVTYRNHRWKLKPVEQSDVREYYREGRFLIRDGRHYNLRWGKLRSDGLVEVHGGTLYQPEATVLSHEHIIEKHHA